MNKDKILRVGDKSFTLVKKEKLNYYYESSRKTLFKCYDKPSQEKINIYEKWTKFFNDYDFDYYGIVSFNNFYFSLGADKTINGKKYFFYISYTRQEYCEI